MVMLFFLLFSSVSAYSYNNDTVGQQLLEFRAKTAGPIGILTTSAGAPVEYKDATQSINTNLLLNEYFIDSLTHLNRERIPERVVHARGGGAFGYLEITHDITNICSAKLFNAIGKRTPLAVRFSVIFQGVRGHDTSRDTRGFAVKFYTEDGNFDIVGLNTEVFVMKDPLLFPTFAHSLHRNPKTFIMDANSAWDFRTSRPESLNIFMRIFGDRGIPDGYRHMPGFGVHTFQVVNDRGENSFVKFHFIPDAGVKNLLSEDGRRLAGEDPDYANRDLYNAIANGNYPSWTFGIQVIREHEVKNAKFDVFDITKSWPEDEYPVHPVGRMVLNKNPDNYFAQVEQAAYNPANLVPGILGGVDKLFESRRFSYRDAQYYRLGANYHKIEVNSPMTHAATYNRDGIPPVEENGKDSPNYFPNSFNGPVPYLDKVRSGLIPVYTDPSVDNFDQAARFVKEMSEGERSRLIENIASDLGNAAPFLQDKAIKLYTLIDPDLGQRLEHRLYANTTKYAYY